MNIYFDWSESYKIAELTLDLILHPVKADNQFLVARDPVSNRVRKILLIPCLLLAFFSVQVSFFLKVVSEVPASMDTLSAQFQA